MTPPITDDKLETLRVAYALMRPGERWSNPHTIPALIARIDELKAELAGKNRQVALLRDPYA